MCVGVNVFRKVGAPGGSLRSPALGTQENMGFLPRTVLGYLHLERLAHRRRGGALSDWIPVLGLGNKGRFPEVQQGACLRARARVAAGAKPGGRPGRPAIQGEGCRAILLSTLF